MSKSLLAGSAALSLLMSSVSASYIQYATIPGFFLQDDAATVPGTFSYVDNNFGLIDQVYDTDAVFDPTGVLPAWLRFENKVTVLNAEAPAGTEYKVLYLGRHGEGYHNVAETYYGTPAWNCYWSELDGNGTIVWSDAEITPNGATQATIAHNFWISQAANQGQSLPQSFYTSPLTRCLHTAALTFTGLTPSDFSPMVKELFREGISMHTCDRRGSKTYIHGSYPSYRFENDFTETDELWKGFEAETSAAEDVRLRTALDSVFSSDPSIFVSVTSHSGAIASMLRVLGHQVFGLVTGAVIPVLVKADTVEGGPAPTSIVSWNVQATCTVPPITSLATGGCVCPPPTTTSSPTSASATDTTSTSSPTSSTSTSTYTPHGTAPSSTYTPNGTGSPSSSLSSQGPYGNSTVPYNHHSSSTVGQASVSVSMTPSVVYTTYTSTITSCAASITACPYGSVTTITEILYTTTCPISNIVSSPPTETTSIIYATTTSTGPEGIITTATVPLYTTTVPLASVPIPASYGTNSTSPLATGTIGSAAPTASFVTGVASGKSFSLSSRVFNLAVAVVAVGAGIAFAL